MMVETGEEFANAIENRVHIAVVPPNQCKTSVIESVYVSVARLEEWKPCDYIFWMRDSEIFSAKERSELQQDVDGKLT